VYAGEQSFPDCPPADALRNDEGEGSVWIQPEVTSDIGVECLDLILPVVQEPLVLPEVMT
jgi:hypothetical protein